MGWTVAIKTNGLAKFEKILEKDLRTRANGPIRQALEEMAEIYRTFLLARYDKYSAGAGSWPPIAESTKKRKGNKKILKDTETLREAFYPKFVGKPGQLNQHIPFGIRVGIKGDDIHPTNKISIGELVDIHQRGLGNNPVRKLIVGPPAPVQNQMTAAMRRGCKQLIKDTLG